jgi:hypothetical protein
VFCTAEDLLPEKEKNARGSVTDAEVVTLAVAQETMGSDHDAHVSRESPAGAWGTCSPSCPSSPTTGSAANAARRRSNG